MIFLAASAPLVVFLIVCVAHAISIYSVGMAAAALAAALVCGAADPPASTPPGPNPPPSPNPLPSPCGASEQ